MLIWKGYGNYTGIILEIIQGIIILAFCKANKGFQKSIGTDRYNLIEQSDKYVNWQVVLKFSALNCFEMHVVREIGLSSHSDDSKLRT